MFKLKNNIEIGKYLKKLIIEKHGTCRKFCNEYINISNGQIHTDLNNLCNRLSQILNGKKSIQVYDLPIFSELLDVSCEQMLTAGAMFTPRNNRQTNYSISFINDEKIWNDYIEHQDNIAYYADEYGKTVIDYAIEFKNYEFIKFLIKKDYITLISNDNSFDTFIPKTKFNISQFRLKTLEDSLYDNKILRTKIISLALEQKDNEVLVTMKAKEFPFQKMVSYNLSDLKTDEYYDDEYIEKIICSEKEVIQYFCEEYEVKSNLIKEEFKWLFPYIDKLIVKAIEKKINHNIINNLLDAVNKHNNDTFKKLKEYIYLVAKNRKSFYKNISFSEIIKLVINEDIKINTEKNVVSFYDFDRNIPRILTNIVFIDVKINNQNLQTKIDNINELYYKIINKKIILNN